MTRVAIVVVTHQSGQFVGPCLDSLRRIDDAEIVVIDNNSTDSGPNEVRQRGVRLIANDNNLGFAAAVNQGVRATASPLVLLVNPDLTLETGIEGIANRFDDSEIGAAGGLLLGSDGKPQAGFTVRNLPTPAALALEVLGINRLWPGNPVNWHYRCLGKDLRQPGPTEQPPGAFLMFRRSIWEKLGGFDESFYPVWFEDVDFCSRIKNLGSRVWFEPMARARHSGGHSVGRLSWSDREKYWYVSLLRYAAKHFRWFGLAAVRMAVAVAVAGRSVVKFPARGPESVAVYFEVFCVALGIGRGVETRSSGNVR